MSSSQLSEDVYCLETLVFNEDKTGQASVRYYSYNRSIWTGYPVLFVLKLNVYCIREIKMVTFSNSVINFSLTNVKVNDMYWRRLFRYLHPLILLSVYTIV